LDWASKRVSRESADLLGQMLCYDRHMRITAAYALKHPFIQRTYEHCNHSPQVRKEVASVLRSMPESFAVFGSEPVLVRAALSLMAHLAYNEETDAHRVAYSMLDRVGSGELSMESIEATAAMPKYASKLIPTNFDEAFSAVDPNGHGYTSFGTFLAATLPKTVRLREDLCRHAFNLLDQNHDGFIDQQDLAVVFGSEEKKSTKELNYLREGCRQSIIEVSGSSKEVRLDFDTFFKAIVGSPSSIASTVPAVQRSVRPKDTSRGTVPILTTSVGIEKQGFVSWFFGSPMVACQTAEKH